MDAVSAAASIWALVELTGKVIGYLKGAKDAHSDQRNLENELRATYRLLLRLADFGATSGDPDTPLANITIVDLATFDEYKQVLQNLYSKVQGRASSVRGALTWPFKKEDVRDMLARLQRLQQAIGVGLGIHTLYVVQAVCDEADVM